MVEIIGGDKDEAPQGEKPKIIIPGGADEPAPQEAPSGAGGPDIEVDEDWKEQARRDAEAMDEKMDADAEAKAGKELPPADFKNFLNGLVEQCLMELGAVVHPMLGQRVVNPPMAKYTIEVIEMLKEKTEGNLDAEEQKFMDEVLHALRIQFMNVTKQLLEAAERGELKTVANPGEAPMGAVPPEAKP